MTRSRFANLFDWCDLHASRWQKWQRRDRHWNLSFDDELPRYFDRHGFPIPNDGPTPACVIWAMQRETSAIVDVRVAYDELPDGSHLSTVWLGMDHGWGGPPLIFETMRFSGETHTVTMPAFRDVAAHEYEARESLEFPDPFGEPGETTDQLRYTTEEEALAAHHEIVRRIRIQKGH